MTSLMLLVKWLQDCTLNDQNLKFWLLSTPASQNLHSSHVKSFNAKTV